MDKFLDIKAKKSLGQNFLKSKKALLAMINAGEVGENDIVLEAGPGKGALTEELLKKAGKVIAVEKDSALVEFLRQNFSPEIASGKLQLVHGDILEFNPATCHLQPKTYNLPLTTCHLQPTTFPSQPATYKLIANIPYYITGQFLRKFLSGANSRKNANALVDIQPAKMVILLQKEVVKRIMANDGKESILSISVKAYGRPKNIGKVSKENFSPKPKVDSAILLIDNISRDFFTCHSRTGGNPDSRWPNLDPRFHGDDREGGNDIAEPFVIQTDEKRFFEIVKAGFAHKRKILARNIESLAKNKEQIEEIFKNCGIPSKARAENLKIEQWKCLSSML